VSHTGCESRLHDIESEKNHDERHARLMAEENKSKDKQRRVTKKRKKEAEEDKAKVKTCRYG